MPWVSLSCSEVSVYLRTADLCLMSICVIWLLYLLHVVEFLVRSDVLQRSGYHILHTNTHSHTEYTSVLMSALLINRTVYNRGNLQGLYVSVLLYLDSRNGFCRRVHFGYVHFHHISHTSLSELFLIRCNGICLLLKVRTKAWKALHTQSYHPVSKIQRNMSHFLVNSWQNYCLQT